MSSSLSPIRPRAGRWAFILCLTAVMAACSLPRSGPRIGEIDPDDSDVTLPFSVVRLSGPVVAATEVDERLAMPPSFRTTGEINSALLGVGDVLSVAIWENADDAVFSGPGQRVARIEQLQVDTRGLIYVPYVGTVRASGRSLARVRSTIRSALADRALEPQVEVRLVQSTSKFINLQGAVARSGIYPIEPYSRTLLPMLAQAGGVSIEPETAAISLRRDGRVGKVWLQDLYDDPSSDIALRPGDTVVLERDTRAFTAFGALTSQRRVPFPTRNISALDALGSVGGLNDSLADPTGVFIFRVEPPEIAALVLDDPAITEPKRIAYILDMTLPDSLFLGESFQMRDGDTIFVTNSPFTRLQKILSAVAPAVNFANSAANLGSL